MLQIQLHGLDLRSALAAGPETGLSALDLTRFTQLQTLRMSAYSPSQASGHGWRLGLPLSLRVLHMDDLAAESFEVNTTSHRTFLAADAWTMLLDVGGTGLVRMLLRPEGPIICVASAFTVNADLCCDPSDVLPTSSCRPKHQSEATPAAAVCLQGGAIAHLTALQELRLCPGAGVQAFNMQLARLPPSLRSLEVVNCREPLDPYPRLVVEAPAPGPTVSDSLPSPLIGTGFAAGTGGPSSLPVASQPASPAIPSALKSVVMDYLLMALPAP